MASSEEPSTPPKFKNKSVNSCIYSMIHRDVYHRKTDWAIQSTEADGCDADGFKYWIECKNGWHDRSWYLKNAKDKTISDLLESYLQNGIALDDKVYHSSKRNNFKSMLERIVKKTKFAEHTYTKDFKSY